MSHIDVGHAVVEAPLDEVCARGRGGPEVRGYLQACPAGSVRSTPGPAVADETTPGKSGENSDVGEVGFVSVEEPGRIVEEADFVSDDPDLAGTKTMTWYLEPGDGGTLAVSTATDVPDGISSQDHAKAFASTLSKPERVCLGATTERRETKCGRMLVRLVSASVPSNSPT